MEDRSRTTETVRPQRDEYCRCPFLCDSALVVVLRQGRGVNSTNRKSDAQEDMEGL